MGKIKILPEETANKIAAGEVVERPSSVIKELVENSLDANANKINIKIYKGGIKKIVVSDNGEGMDKQDLHLSLKRHATSKIFSEEDITHISSMGFRGEALASIASVSKFTINSKQKDQTHGYSLQTIGGKVIKIQPIGMHNGTQVIVKDLFFNVPARKKFLKSIQTEQKHNLEVITALAMANSKIGFTVFINDRLKINLTYNQDNKERIKSILGSNLFSQMIPLQHNSRHVKIKGYVSKPQVSSDTRQQQYIFVNKRFVKSPLVVSAVKEAFGTLLAPKTYPRFVILISLNQDMIDVNVHPRKEEVKFINTSLVYNHLIHTVRKTLASTNLTYVKETYFDLKNKDYQKKFQFSGYSKLPQPTIPQIREPLTKYELPLIWEQKEETKQEIIQIHNLYLVTQTETGILIIDQHAAHERILFEKFWEKFIKNTSKYETQPLLFPEIIELSPQETDLLSSYLNTLQSIGLEIENFGQNSFKINTVPNLLKQKSITQIIKQAVDDLQENKVFTKISNKDERIIATLACRSAIKAGDKLTKIEIKGLIKDLAKTKTEYTCPHGRPVKITISLKELAKMFKRS